LRSTETEAPVAEGQVAPATAAAGPRQVAIDAILPNPYQPRRTFEPAALEELAESIRTHGVIQPLLVMPDGDGYRLIAGERRWHAARAAGLSHVPVVTRDVGRQEMLALAIIENVQRTDLGPMETAEAYRRLTDEFDLTQTEVARLVGKSRAAVANTVRLLNLAPDVRQLVVDGHLSEGHARALLTIEDPALQTATAHRAVAGGWTVRQIEAQVRSSGRADEPAGAAGLPGGQERAGARLATLPPEQVDPDTAAAAKALETALGTRVEIRRRGTGGQLVVYFYSEEELAALYDRLVDDR